MLLKDESPSLYEFYQLLVKNPEGLTHSDLMIISGKGRANTHAHLRRLKERGLIDVSDKVVFKRGQAIVKYIAVEQAKEVPVQTWASVLK